MRRIVVIAAGMAGINCATRIKRRLPDSEVNVIIPAGLENSPAPAPEEAQTAGATAARLRKELPDLATLATRDVGILEAQDIMPDLDAQEVVITSSRGSVNIRYTDLILDVPATVRLPRALQKASNVFGWPITGFSSQPQACDLALEKAVSEGMPVIVAGGGLAALDAVFLAREAGAQVRWLATAEQELPDVDPLLLEHILKELGPDVIRIPLQKQTPDRFVWQLNSEGTLLEAVSLADGTCLRSPCWLWTYPLMARHPILREKGVELDSFGRMKTEEDSTRRLHIIGSGSAVPPAFLPVSELHAPVYVGTEENSGLSALLALSALIPGVSYGDRAGALGAVSARTRGICLCRAGYSMAEATRNSLDVEYAVMALSDSGGTGSSRLILSLVCAKQSRTLIGAQVLGLGGQSIAADGLFGMAAAAVADGSSLETLVARPGMGLPGRLLAGCAGILLNKLDTIVNGISPDELLASHAAGAEFFILDVRPEQEWKQGHLAQAHNIPLPQLKKRLQAEVPRMTPLVLVSADGTDAYAAACRLAALGASSLYVLDGGMRLWPYGLEKE